MGAAGAPMPMYLQFRRAGVDLQPELLGLGAGDADDRRHRALDRPGDRRAAARLDCSRSDRDHLAEINVLVVGVLLVLFVVGAPEGIIGLFRSVPPRGGQVMTRRRDRRTAPEDRGADQALRRLHRARRREPRDRAGRALRPDRAQRLGQDDADQLHLRLAAQRAGLDRCSTARTSRACRPTSARAAASPAASRSRGRSAA